MKFEFSRSFLMGLAVAGLMTSCGGSGGWVDSPDDWAQMPMPGESAAPAAPRKAPKVSAKPEKPPVKTAVTETPAEPKKTSWWGRKDDKEASKKGATVAEKKPEKKAEAPRREATAAVRKKGDFPTAVRANGFGSYVRSPYDDRFINVKGIPSGSLVADPRYPLDQRKYFRVP